MEEMLAKERGGIHLWNIIDQVMAPDLILKIDKVD